MSNRFDKIKEEAGDYLFSRWRMEGNDSYDSGGQVSKNQHVAEYVIRRYASWKAERVRRNQSRSLDLTDAIISRAAQRRLKGR